MAEAGTVTPGALGRVWSPWGSQAGTVRAGGASGALPGSVSLGCSATAIVLLVRKEVLGEEKWCPWFERSRVRLGFKGKGQELDCPRTSKLIFLLAKNYLSIKLVKWKDT